METWFYDRFGSPSILLLNSGGRFIDRAGNNLGYVYGDKIYNFKGKHCGWIERGLIRDLNGHAVCFALGVSDFPIPVPPIPQLPPIPPIPKIPPIPAIKEIPRLKPFKKFGWSAISPLKLFN